MSKEFVVEGWGRDEFLNAAVKYNPNVQTALIGRAYDFAENAHKGQKRLCRRDFFMHCKEVAYMLMKLRLDTATICAGLLHDVIEDTKTRPDELKRIFGEEVFSLVNGVTKTARISLESGDEERAENIRKVLLATIKDIRVILIKLADRLHNMRTLKYQPPENQAAVSQETLDIFVPISYKLGMYRIKSELEDLCLRYLKPEVYQSLKQRISKKRDERDREVRELMGKVKRLLEEKGINATITGRAKNFYSIYKKMTKKKIPFEQVNDLYAIRIITESQDDCYRILGIIHSIWTPISSRFDDYIASPKQNMYQSLHTEVVINGKPVEVQARTWKMHYIAEEGIAAHWRYKDAERDKKFDRKIAWLKQILEWRMTANAKDFLENLKIDLFKDEIYAITPKGDTIPLPEKSTPVDFAYAVHTDIGNHCKSAKVNHIIVPLDQELNSGDIVEIITAKNATPSRNWLKFVRTNHAKSKIRGALKIAVGEAQPAVDSKDEEQLIGLIDFPKVSLLKLAGCCSPQYEDSITGYRMKDGKIAVHKVLCENIKKLDPNRKIYLGWKKQSDDATIKLRAEVIDRSGLFQDILSVLTRNGLRIEAINTKSIRDKLYLLLEIKPPSVPEILDETVSSIRKVSNVVDVRVE
ncbi:bifunctional (p)ppGpp synthetase/guanosine-3',5'-bis(diphosphate) 3'-pyrophosphohydrolase [Candidatus Woesearchaeota archaeon]|nr:bifunctional (p)ppGpp synthetase/guanosine-3',5'-bis(diphosphate) 3'-pyrophosphohydrolase [Candidatus Woesearchaeota archaeon]